VLSSCGFEPIDSDARLAWNWSRLSVLVNHSLMEEDLRRQLLVLEERERLLAQGGLTREGAVAGTLGTQAWVPIVQRWADSQM